VIVGRFADGACLSRERWESRVTPRILMWSDNETEQPATSTERREA